jgi:very-short-patch-repair endonuclease
MPSSDLERSFDTYWNILAPKQFPNPVAEYRFTDERKYRLDRAWHEFRVAIELQGGVGSRGRHVRWGGYQNDCAKLNLAQSLGWVVFWVTSDMLESDPLGIVEMICDAIEKRNSALGG